MEKNYITSPCQYKVPNEVEKDKPEKKKNKPCTFAASLSAHPTRTRRRPMAAQPLLSIHDTQPHEPSRLDLSRPCPTTPIQPSVPAHLSLYTRVPPAPHTFLDHAVSLSSLPGRGPMPWARRQARPACHPAPFPLWLAPDAARGELESSPSRTPISRCQANALALPL